MVVFLTIEIVSLPKGMKNPRFSDRGFTLLVRPAWATRLRTYIWKSWKTIGNKYRNLRKLGTSHANAMRMANTRKGYRRSADSPIVKLAISKELLKKAGYTFFLDDYLKVTA